MSRPPLPEAAAMTSTTHVNAEAGPSTPRPAPETPTKSRRRSWFGFGGFSSTPVTPRGSKETGRDRDDGEGALELVDRAVRSDGDTSTAGALPDNHNDGSGLASDKEILTIDAHPVGSPRRSKIRSSAQTEDEGEVVALSDLRRPSSRSTVRPTDPGLRVSVEGDHDTTAAIHQTDFRPKPPASHPFPAPRTSSLGQSMAPPPRSSYEKRTPSLPIDRPLPALPPEPGLAPPSEIVIIPSSPRKLQKPASRSASASMTDLRKQRKADQTSSRSSSRSRLTISRKSSLVGLGFPPQRHNSDAPPPVPSKPVSVSSPHPSRSASPVPRIAFIEPEEEERGRHISTASQPDKAKRARSLSGIFTRSPVPAATEGNKEEEKVEVLKDEEETGKMSGVLEWLGMKKAGKRRGSDGKALDRLLEAEQSAAIDEKAGPSHPSRDQNITDSSDKTIVLAPSPSITQGEAGQSRSYPLPTPIAVPPHPDRQFTASSSSSSLNVPLPAPSPNFISRQSSWVASPSREEEEIMFSPPGAPWVETPIGSPQWSGQSSPLSPTPEEGAIPPPSAGVQAGRDGRARAWSDAPQPSNSLVATALGNATATAPGSPIIRSAEPSPLLSPRPKMGPRSNSGNSAIIDRVKGVFAKSTSSKNRHRSKSLLPPDNRDAADEFGNLTQSSGRSRPSTAGSATSRDTNASLLDLHGTGPPRSSGQRSSRTSFSETTRSGATAPTSQSSTGQAERPSRGSIDAQPPPILLQPRTRNRASTVSFASSAPTAPPSSFAPPSPSILALGATPPRRRPSAISRLSGGRLCSTPNSPKGGSLFPLPPRSSGSTIGSGTTSIPGLSADEGTTGSTHSILLSPVESPRPSTSSFTNGRESVKQLSRVEDGETIADWLDKVGRSVGSDEIAGVLAASADEFHTEALRLYMEQFDFTHEALDIALRKLLLKMSLPKETQQIDRVIEAFAARYEACEPALFGDKDNTYVLAFSMMMLHTDAFNKHNKNKMTKPDYVRNTRLDGVSPTVLEAFYDNITFTPFVYQDDPATPAPSAFQSLSGTRSRSGSDVGPSSYPFPTTPGTATTMSSSASNGSYMFSLATPRSATVSLGGSKTEVYGLISSNGLAALRVDVETMIPPISPFSCLGTGKHLDTDTIHDCFVSAGVLRIDASPSKKRMGRRKGGEEETVLRVTKVGLISRRDDTVDHGKKASRRWKSWSVILTGSQLLFFKDPFWALTLLEQARGAKRNEKGQLIYPAVGTFVPDEVFPVKDCVAVYDRDCTQPHTFRFHLPNRQYLMTANDDHEMNEWIRLINYAAAFKTGGVRMRASHLGRAQAVLAGAAAASSFKRENVARLADGLHPRKPKAVFGARPASSGLDSEIEGLPLSNATGSEIAAIASSHPTTLATVVQSAPPAKDVAATSVRINPLVDASEDTIKDGGEQLEEVFDVVKAELATNEGAFVKPASASHHQHSRRGKVASVHNAPSSRIVELKSQIAHFEGKVAAAELALTRRMNEARNLAILTPFQKTTRERIALAVPALAQKVRSERLTLAKYTTYLAVLRHDLDRDERDFARIRHVAMQAAEKSLRDPEGVKSVVEAEGTDGPPSVPTLSLPDDNDMGGSLEGAIRTRSPSPNSLRGHEYDPDHDHRHEQDRDYERYNDDGNVSDQASVLGTTPNELPIMMRKSSEDGRIESDVEQGVSKFARPAFQRQTSANSVASSAGSFFGIKIKSGGADSKGVANTNEPGERVPTPTFMPDLLAPPGGSGSGGGRLTRD